MAIMLRGQLNDAEKSTILEISRVETPITNTLSYVIGYDDEACTSKKIRPKTAGNFDATA